MTRRSFCLAVALAAALIVAVSLAAFALGDTKVETGSCAIAASGSASGNSVTCNFGLTGAQLKQVTEAAVKGATAGLQDHIDKISEALGVTKSAAKALLQIVGEDPNISDDKLAEALSKVAGDYRKLQDQVAVLNPENPTARALVEQAKPEIDAGHFERAHELLRQATQAQITAAQEAGKLEERARAAKDAQMLGAASSTATEGAVALTERRYLEAAELFGQAAGYVPNGHSIERGYYFVSQAVILLRQGDERGDNAALRNSIETCGNALAEYPRLLAPLEWAMTENLIGAALSTLGERERGTMRLEEAVLTFRAALEEGTHERTPFSWAATQRWPMTQGWAMTQVNLGSALMLAGERDGGTARLKEAVGAFHAALEELTRNHVPLEWAAAQNNLGIALEWLGQRESGTARLAEAVAAFRAALEEWTRGRVPFEWARTQNNLGFALQTLGERGSGTAQLEEAVAAFRAALEEQVPERVPLDWAKSFGNQGVALMVIADRTNNSALAQSAVRQIETACETLRSHGDEHWSAYLQARLVQAQAIRDRLAPAMRP